MNPYSHRLFRHVATLAFAALAPAVQAQLGALSVGCDFITNTAEERNTGFLDDNASYAIAHIPLSLPDGASIRIEGLSPAVRYWSLQSYDGARGGNFIDTLPDVRIRSNAGHTNPDSPAELPTAPYGAAYTLTLQYSDPPPTTAQRLPNVLYVGAPDPNAGPLRVARQIIYRIYLPNPGIGRFGNQPLPKLIYSGPEGEIDLANTPDQRQCARIERASSSTRSLNPGIFPSRLIRFVPVARTEDRILYPNGDSTYLRAVSSRNHGDLVVIRTLPFRAPAVPPLLAPTPADVRYLSLCHYELFSSAVVSCIADQDAVVGADGYELHVISTDAARPRRATRADRVNWQPWGQTRGELIVLRQILARPGFGGDYSRAVANPTLPLSVTLNEFAPEISYCEPATFDAAFAAGSALLMNACRQSTERR